jgi:hypothetical protein
VSRTRRAPLVAAALAIVLGTGSAGAQPAAVTRSPIEIAHDGNRLEALRDAPVPCQNLPGFLETLERPLPDRAFAARILRSSPPGATHLTLCVTADGTLIVGSQSFALDARGGRGAFVRGEIERSFPALEGSSPWRWLVPIAVSREVAITLEVKALADVWPVRRVVIRSEYER